MTTATKRSILRGIHLIVTIPILGCIYGKPAEVEQYVPAVQMIFVPIIILSGYWLYAGIVFAVIGVALWLGSIRLFGYPGAILPQLALFIAWKIWRVIRARRKSPVN